MYSKGDTIELKYNLGVALVLKTATSNEMLKRYYPDESIPAFTEWHAQPVMRHELSESYRFCVVAYPEAQHCYVMIGDKKGWMFASMLENFMLSNKGD